MDCADRCTRAEIAAVDRDVDVALAVGVARRGRVGTRAAESHDRAVDRTAVDDDVGVAVERVKARNRDDAVLCGVCRGRGDRTAVDDDGHVADGADRLPFARANRAAADIPPCTAVNLDCVAEVARGDCRRAGEGAVCAAPNGDGVARIDVFDAEAERQIVAAAEDVDAV